jgi:predicted esterase
MKRQLGVLVSSLIVCSACASRDARSVRYPTQAASSPPLTPAPAQPTNALIGRFAAVPSWPAWCLPSLPTPGFPAADLAPFAALVGMAPCNGAGGDGSDASAAASLVPLLVPGFGAAIVSVPRGVMRPKPVVVALHGSADRPEWQCEYMRDFVGNRGFVLCPRGIARGDSKPDDQRYVFAGDTVAEVEAAIDALRITYGPLVDPGPMMYQGFSLGANLAPGIVMGDPSRFPRMLLIEGGTSGWNDRKYADSGGQRVLWACGQAGCAATASALAARLTQKNVPSRVAYAPGAGHTQGGAVADAIRVDWSWLIADDPRWAE